MIKKHISKVKTLLPFCFPFLFILMAACAPQPSLRATNPGNINTPISSSEITFTPAVTSFPIIASASPKPVSTRASTPVISTPLSNNSPDLIIEYLYLEMEGRHGGCVMAYTPYGIRVGVKNVGEAETGAFAVDLNGSRQRVDGGLAPGQSIELNFAGTSKSGQYQAYVDPAHEVAETNKDNNTLSFQAPTPTPPPLCTPTLTPMS